MIGGVKCEVEVISLLFDLVQDLVQVESVLLEFGFSGLTGLELDYLLGQFLFKNFL